MIRAFLLILLPVVAQAQYTVTRVAGGAPATAGLGGGIAGDAAGNIYLCGPTIVSRLSPDGKMTTFAGTGMPGYSGDGGPATSAQVNGVDSCVVDKSGNLIIADANNYRIRRVDAGGTINTIVGNGTASDNGNGGPGTQATVGIVLGLATDAAGNLYFSDSASIRKLNNAGIVQPFAGGGTATGDGGLALNAQIAAGLLAADGAGNVYFSQGLPAQWVRRVSPTGIISTVAGSYTTTATVQDGMPATSGALPGLSGLASDAAGNLYIGGGYFIRRVDAATGIITTIAGTSNTNAPSQGPALSSFLGLTGQIFPDSKGTLWFGQNQLDSLANGVITLIYSHPFTEPADGILATNATLKPAAIAISSSGVLYIAEGTLGCVVRKVGADGKLSTVPVTGTCDFQAATSFNSIAVDSHGTVYASGTRGNGVYSISSSGSVGIVNGLLGGFLTIDSKDRIYEVERNTSEILTLAPGGNIQTLVKELYLPGGFTPAEQAALAVDASDDVFVAATSSPTQVSSSVLYRVGPTGQLTAIPGVYPDNVSAMAIDKGGDYWMVGSNDQISVSGQLAFTTSPSTTYSDGPLNATGFMAVQQIIAAPDGSIYVLDSGCACVRKISLPAVSPAPPSISAAGIVNAASLAGGGVAQGELISIFGSNLGPSAVQSYTTVNNSIPTSLAGVQVSINGVPAPLTAVSAGQINAFVPYLNIRAGVPIALAVSVQGVPSSTLTIPLALSSFGLFTADGSGGGQSASLNQDGSYNSEANPAPAGSIISLFGTGEGGLSPSTSAGEIVTAAPFPGFSFPVTVMIDGQPGDIAYAGAAPFLPAGVDQINVTIPPAAPPGPASIAVNIGGIPTTKNVTVAVK